MAKTEERPSRFEPAVEGLDMDAHRLYSVCCSATCSLEHLAKVPQGNGARIPCYEFKLLSAGFGASEATGSHYAFPSWTTCSPSG